MERLWTPWRMKYLEQAKPDACVLCHKVQEERDWESLMVYRGERAFVCLNLYPYSNGHLLVSPYEHVDSLECLDVATQTELMALVSLSIRLLRHALNPGGFNVGINIGKAAGAGIDDHMHIHVVPRWNGDTNFMPVVGSTRVMPELLEKTLERLVAALPAVLGEKGPQAETPQDG